MTRRQKAAFSVLLGMLENTIEGLEGLKDRAQAEADKLPPDAKIWGGDIAAKLGTFQGVVGYSAEELRRIFEQILETFPSVEVFGS